MPAHWREDIAPVPLSVIRMKDDRILEVNDSLLRQFGYTRDEFIGQTPLTLRMWADPDARAPYVELLSAEKFIDRHELHLLDKQGRDMFCQLSARVFDADGEPMAIFSPIDVTRQRAIEREIRELNTALEERVRQRTATLEQNNVELAGALEKLREAQSELLRTEKMAALGSLVAGVAHELNTPIGNSVTVASTVHEAAQRLTAELTQPTPRRSALQSAAAACLKGAELLGRTLQRAAELVVSFKQVAVDQSSNHRRRFDLRQAIEEVLLTVEPMYMKTSFRVEHELAPSIIMDSYPGALGQIITNFISNALHHGFEGRDIGHMRIITRADATTVELDFIDDGVGIPAQFIERVFDPFFTTKLGQGGSGLGMHIVYNVVTDILGGKVQLESTVGVGTRIHVSMPLIAPYRAEDAVLAA